MATNRKPSDHERLARAFEIPPTKKGMGFFIASAFGTLGALGAPFLFVPAAAAAAGMGVFAIGDRHAIKKGLKELDVWGFPVTGYRDWLLADEPTFDIELKRNVDIQVIITSAAAIDKTIGVTRSRDRGFRLITRRIALPGSKDGAPPIYLGDRRLLNELYERMLSPLHADVGIVSMRMGELATLPAMQAPSNDVPEEHMAPGVEGMGAFRDQAMAAPPALQALVLAGNTLPVPTHGEKHRYQSLRVLHATGRQPAGVGTVIAIGFGGLVSGAQFGPIGIVAGGIVGLLGGVGIAVATNRRNASTASSLLGWHTFPIEHYETWLVSGRPLFEIELMSPVDKPDFERKVHSITAFSEERREHVRWIEGIQWIDDTLVRIETRPTLIQPVSGKIRPFYGGSHILFQRFVNDVLEPLHAIVGIKGVRMGGYSDRRV